MDKANKQVGSSSSSSSSSSSFTVDLFGPKDTSKSSTSSTDFFGSIFGPPTSMVPGKDIPPSDFANAKHGTSTDCKSEKGKAMRKEKNSSYESYYNSSIYYGAQEVYSPTTPNTPPTNFKKDGGNVDQNESNSSASRGNWWQGSLYY